MAAKIGSSEWWTSTADKVLGTALSVIQTKLEGVPATGGDQAAYVSASTPSMSKYVPWVAGGLAVGAIVLIMAKR